MKCFIFVHKLLSDVGRNTHGIRSLADLSVNDRHGFDDWIESGASSETLTANMEDVRRLVNVSVLEHGVYASKVLNGTVTAVSFFVNSDVLDKLEYLKLCDQKRECEYPYDGSPEDMYIAEFIHSVRKEQ
jgi:hypothetical protein